MDEGIPSIDLIPPSPVLSHKSLNILNAQQLGGSNASLTNIVATGNRLLPHAVSSSTHSVVIDDISKSSSTTTAGPIYVPTISSSATTASTLQLPAANLIMAEDSTDLTPLTTPTTAANNLPAMAAAANANSSTAGNGNISANDAMQRIPSFKRFRRGSSKKKKPESMSIAATVEEEEAQLNNGSDNSCLLPPSTVVAATSSNNTKHKDTNRLSPQNSMTRRYSTSLSMGPHHMIGASSSSAGHYGAGSRRASACIFNSQLYHNLNQASKLHPSMGGGAASTAARRMSSFELALTKTSHLNLHNLEANRKSMSYTNSKIDLDKWQNLPYENDMLAQYMEEREKRKNSIANYGQKHYHKSKRHSQQQDLKEQQQQQQHSMIQSTERVSKLKILIERLKPKNFTEDRDDYSLYIFSEDNR